MKSMKLGLNQTRKSDLNGTKRKSPLPSSLCGYFHDFVFVVTQLDLSADMLLPFFCQFARLQIRDLNSGTFGFVQLALDKTTGRQCAIKFIERGEKVGLIMSLASFFVPVFGFVKL